MGIFGIFKKKKLSQKGTTTNSHIWKEMKMPPEYEKVAEAYFNAIITSCRERGLVLTVEHGFFVCVLPDYLYTIPILNIKRAESLRTISQFLEFLEIHKNLVDKHMKDKGYSPAGKAEYWDIFMGQMTSMINESGAVQKIIEIDKQFGLQTKIF